MAIPAVLTNAYNAASAAAKPLATTAWGVFQARPLSTSFLTLASGKAILAMLQEGESVDKYKRTRDYTLPLQSQGAQQAQYGTQKDVWNYPGSFITRVAVIGTVLWMIDGKIAPTLMSNLKNHTLSSALFGFGAYRALNTAHDQKDKLELADLGVLLAATAIRFGGPFLTHKYLAWVR